MRTPVARIGRLIEYLPLLLAAVAALALMLHSGDARPSAASAAMAASHPASDHSGKLTGITIEAQRNREELERRVDHFVSSAIVSYLNFSLVRWNQPICPLVGGLPGDLGEFVLARISQVARAAHAPLAGRHCRANLYVVATAYPDLLLKKWAFRDPRIHNMRGDVVGNFNAFLHSSRPVRVWYNITLTAEDGPRTGVDAASVGIGGLDNVQVFTNSGSMSILQYGVVQQITSAIIIVDLNQTKRFTIGQLADYVALAGLAQVDLQADTGKAPTILDLFRAKHPPQSLTAWDQALLYCLYGTSQQSVMQVPLMRTHMLAMLAPPGRSQAVSGR
jgi:hypothetical protein